jgi:hypothetical protein
MNTPSVAHSLIHLAVVTPGLPDKNSRLHKVCSQLTASTPYIVSACTRSCRISWPKPPALRYPQELHSLVTLCLAAEHSQRPTVMQLLERVQELLAAGLPDPS